MLGPLFLSVTARNHISGIVSATISRDPDTPNQRITKYKPLHTPASSLAHRPCYTQIKQKRKRTQDRDDNKADFDDPVDENEGSTSPLAKRARPDPINAVVEKYSAGGLLMDPNALTTPDHYSIGQIKWAEAMVYGLLQGARKQWEFSRFRCVDICGDEHVRVLASVEELPIDLVEDPVVTFIAMTGAYLCHAGSQAHMDRASCDDVLKLSKMLHKLRAWLGLCKDLDSMLEAYEKIANE